jgi:hypothetical protein
VRDGLLCCKDDGGRSCCAFDEDEDDRILREVFGEPPETDQTGGGGTKEVNQAIPAAQMVTFAKNTVRWQMTRGDVRKEDDGR